MNLLPGSMDLNDQVPEWVRRKLVQMGYKLNFEKIHLGPHQRHLFR